MTRSAPREQRFQGLVINPELAFKDGTKGRSQRRTVVYDSQISSSEEWMERGKFICPEFFFHGDSGGLHCAQEPFGHSSSYFFHYHSVMQRYSNTRDTNQGERVTSPEC